ncbi:divalent-cation tolerance protein CutA [Pseudidiomarina terrestris]|uniref:Divalent-cation tolerance protein CutA n=1 Tax=Pseudidiomarina terrestris TaxID=2820060 RepID=A0AAW7QYV5_9GAMM|nr:MULTISPECIES: divalent-cation tolerance protein CutA [unclassified Pseudidiomarina]MDN7125053.1 divalent-cation tolerance protein CutA [Pseudidiomarina sp. 1APP75-32.1]MDN7128192.1 divalent-cation tolerance protein CutA [Pseudidiomarina sp. 1APR75-33.1]MDN7129472.1 divalent-cation tolerance protein CutA [Pseudidiomarina sp. 1APR75-15]MDN7135788.1 divalent-cation tolerance protein CutA [Pseudidiomarina sp. 1ASP75-5]MDN7138268.1 divalent-cation tolerance protein CutA [Pseudidiomarina sp. 1ASP
MTTSFQVVLCSCPDKGTAKAIAEKVLRARLAACVNIGAPSTSIYWWDDHLHSDEEVMLAIKTSQQHLEALIAMVEAAHPYDVAELIALPVTAGSEAYLSWLKEVIT